MWRRTASFLSTYNLRGYYDERSLSRAPCRGMERAATGLFQCLFPSSSVCFVPTPSRVFFTADTYHRPRAARQTASQHTLAFIKVNVGFCFGLRGDASTGGRQASSFLLVVFWFAAYVSCNCSEIR